jgi:hypothetical protein
MILLIVYLFNQDSNLLVILLLTVLLIRFLGELINTIHLKKQINKGKLDIIVIEKKKNKDWFWNTILVFWILSLIPEIIMSNYFWLVISIGNVLICFDYMYFINLKSDYIIYNNEEIYLKYFFIEKRLKFVEISAAKAKSKSIVILTSKNKTYNFKYNPESSKEAVNVIKEKLNFA